MTTLFYAPGEAIGEGVVELPEEEARHAVRVLRHREGDVIEVVDGAGTRHRVRLTWVERERVIGEVIASEDMVGEPEFELTIGLGLIKNASRFETFVEKAVELGVGEIVPLVTARTEHVRLRDSRLHNIMVAAMKQSGRCRLPVLHEPQPLEDLLERATAHLRYICHEAAPGERSLTSRLAATGRIRSLAVLVGPEGGFSDAELGAAQRAGWEVVSLGPRRLRAETAAILAAGTVMLRAEG